jgi:xanthine dehydrogenase accessory factor
MRNLTADIEKWQDQGKEIAQATVVHVWGSAPRPLGSRMAISSDGDISGSVSGGCVEGAVVEVARAVIESGLPKLVRFDVTNDEAWSVGLTCGGVLEVFIAVLNSGAGAQQALESELAADRISTLATIVDGPGAGNQLLIRSDGSRAGDLGSPDLDAWATWAASSDLHGNPARRRKIETRDGEVAPEEGPYEVVDVFIEVKAPLPRLIIIGAVHVAIPLVSFAKTLGFRTIVVDPRSAFATEERFAHADEIIVKWPEEALAEIGVNPTTSVAVLSHDLKIDVPALRAALASPARYVGALGSKKTQAKRVVALQEDGVPDEQIARIHSPIGLDIGGRKAEEIALSVIAEVVAASHGRA